MAKEKLEIVSNGRSGSDRWSGPTPPHRRRRKVDTQRSNHHRNPAPAEGLWGKESRWEDQTAWSEQNVWEEENVRASKLFVIFRLLFLIESAGLFVLSIIPDGIRSLLLRLRGRSAPSSAEQNRARRFRMTLQRMGGTWVKIGQQMSLRTDILPRVYCEELKELLDSGETLDPAYVREVIERQTGYRLERVFQQPFDFKAVGRGSVACVYRGRLPNGTLVAIKIRRPNIRRIFDADLTALDWFLRTAEFLTIVRPGISYSLRSELRRMLLDELDFRAEQRYQELFRRYLKRWRKLRVTAPRPIPRLSGNEVIVSEFVEGIWMRQLLDLVELHRQVRMLLQRPDIRRERSYRQLIHQCFERWLALDSDGLLGGIAEKTLLGGMPVGEEREQALLWAVAGSSQSALDRLAQKGIRPKGIARRLIRASHFQFFECPFFHADPHPANILIQSGGRIVMVDFGACGVFAQRDRAYLRQMHEAQEREDIGAMVDSVIHLMEPLPSIDVDAFRSEMEHAWWLGFYGMKSKSAGWQERTSFRLWRELFRLVRKHGIPLPLNVLRMIRATLLYDTVAARLYPGLDIFKEYKKYFRAEGKRAQKRICRTFWRQAFGGPSLSNYLLLERFCSTSRTLLSWVENFANQGTWRFSSLISKGYSLLVLSLKWFIWMVSLSFVAFTTVTLANDFKSWRQTGEIEWGRLFFSDMGSGKDVLVGVWFFLVVLISAKYIHQLWFRVFDPDR